MVITEGQNDTRSRQNVADQIRSCDRACVECNLRDAVRATFDGDFCHLENAFDKDDKETKQTARKMMRMMFTINRDNFDGHNEVTCYACHRGAHKPVATPIISEEPIQLALEEK